MGVFSAYYNFYFELCKRLKLRMKEERKNFKFRKIYIRGRSSSAHPKSGKITAKKIIRKKPARTSKSAAKAAAKAAKLVEEEKQERVDLEDQVNIDTDYGGEIEEPDSQTL